MAGHQLGPSTSAYGLASAACCHACPCSAPAFHVTVCSCVLRLEPLFCIHLMEESMLSWSPGQVVLIALSPHKRIPCVAVLLVSKRNLSYVSHLGSGEVVVGSCPNDLWGCKLAQCPIRVPAAHLAWSHCFMVCHRCQIATTTKLDY